jgi:predicted nucleic acid binding AN1-type Zn finger protein
MAAQRRGAAAAAAADGSVSNEASPSDKAGSAKKKNRCAMCSKKVGVMGFECRCDQVFCAEHRYPHVHNCAFDVKALTKSNIAKANPKVQESKIDKL